MMSITEKEFNQLANYIQSNYGIHLKREKKSLVIGRLHNELINRGVKDFSEYYELLIHDKTGQSAITLINKITTNHTYFMRESDHFYFFRDQVLPYLKANSKHKDLRIWSAACSSGEEAYTLAMVIDEYLGIDKSLWERSILATDISRKVLEIAKEGVYSEENILPIPNTWKSKFFERKKDVFHVKEEIKKQVVFRNFNLIESKFPFKKKFQTIFCRNVIIYFNNETKLELLNKFYNALDYGGYLFIGHSESIRRDQTQFQHVMPSVYRKM